MNNSEHRSLLNPTDEGTFETWVCPMGDRTCWGCDFCPKRKIEKVSIVPPPHECTPGPHGTWCPCCCETDEDEE